MPQGTFLSNPSTAPDGGLGGSQGMNPATPQLSMWGTTTPGYNPTPPQNPSVGGNPFLPGGAGYAVNQAAQHQPSILQDLGDWFRGEGRYAGNPDILLRSILAPSSEPQKSIFTAQNSRPSNTLVGNDISSSPEFVTAHQMNQLLGGVTPKEQEQFMLQKGYVRSYEAGVGEIWIKTGEAQPGAGYGGLDERGRPEYVDPTALEVGERMTAASGVTFVGGQDYTDPGGTTVSQYAMTLPDNIGSDPHGRYKWKSTVRKDRDGNWVRTYSRQLRKVHTRSHRKKQAARAEEAQALEGRNGATAGEVNQLVAMRVNFG